MKNFIIIILIVLLQLNIGTYKQENIAEESNTYSEIQDKEDLPNQNLLDEEPSEYLFDTSEGKYNYCPVGIMEDEKLYVAYCTNKEDKIIEDHIGIWQSKEQIILYPSESGWDSKHVCDPSIIKGNFKYNNVEYKYLMAYLGCETEDCQRNQIGFAVSNSLTSEWIKCNNINPVIKHQYDPTKQKFQWGVGQPSLISLNKSGEILLFYTSGTYKKTKTYAIAYDASDLNKLKILYNVGLSSKGVDYAISNADFAINGNTLYMCCDTRPFSGNILSNIADSESIYCTTINNLYNKEEIFNCEWTLIDNVNSTRTGHQKNHNAGFIRDAYGGLYSMNEMLITCADEKNDFCNSLFSYRIKKVPFTFNN